MEEKIGKLDEEMAAVSTDFVKTESIDSRKRGNRKAAGRKDGSVDVPGGTGCENCGTVVGKKGLLGSAMMDIYKKIISS